MLILGNCNYLIFLYELGNSKLKNMNFAKFCILLIVKFALDNNFLEDKVNKQQLASKIWESANKMRSKIDANEYKDYILGFIFYKFVSEIM